MATMTRREVLAAGLATGTGLAAGLFGFTPRARGSGLGRWSGQPDAGADAWFFPWKEIAPGIHTICDPASGGNCLLVVRDGVGMLVDTKYPPIAPALLREARARGAALRYAVNTHHHGDHTGGNHIFNAAGVSTIAHPRAAERILENTLQYKGAISGGPKFVASLAKPNAEQVIEEAGQMSLNIGRYEDGDWHPTEQMIADEQEIRFGSASARLVHFGRSAHTDNDVVVHLPEPNVLHTGDLVFSGLHPFFDPTAGVTARGWIKSLHDARALCNDDTTVVPGHGALGGPEIIDAARVHIERLLEAVQGAIDEGLTKEQAQEKSWDFMQGLGFEQIRPRSIGAVYDELKGNT